MIVLPDGTPYTGPVAPEAPPGDPFVERALIWCEWYWRMPWQERREFDRTLGQLLLEREEP